MKVTSQNNNILVELNIREAKSVVGDFPLIMETLRSELQEMIDCLEEK